MSSASDTYVTNGWHREGKEEVLVVIGEVIRFSIMKYNEEKYILYIRKGFTGEGGAEFSTLQEAKDYVRQHYWAADEALKKLDRWMNHSIPAFEKIEQLIEYAEKSNGDDD